MANKLKKSNSPKNTDEKAGREEKQVKSPKISAEKLKVDKEEKVDLKKLARDERTWKIIGTGSLLISIFLFISFVSYLFTWQEDQSQVINKGVSFLFDNNKESQVSNLLGRLGAYSAHNLIYNGFGIASFLFCTFFFVLGI
ncbi:MAG TPA: DNA translocase FtsK 4TM domain-containing protein, partial [Flavisolibacter sp.]|nr:DNA translocase FtsK 4TM domain-containing protein [Flavisolibacter sp.]